MRSKRTAILVVLTLLSLLVVSGCDPYRKPVVEKVVKETVVQKEVVKETVLVPSTPTPEVKPTEAAPAQEATSRMVVRGDFSDAEVINPILSSDTASEWIEKMMFNGLVQTNPKDATVMPDLAESWEVSADGLTFTYKLRKNAKFHDGQPCTAKDVKFTYEMILNEAVNSPRRADFVDLLRPENIVIVDDYTIKFTLNRIDASWLCCKDIYGILPEHILGKLTPAEFNAAPFNTSAPIGTGPFMFKEWVKDDHITLVKNPDYFLGAPKIDAWSYKVVENETVAFAQLQTQESDMTAISAALWEEAQNQSHLECRAYPRFGFTFYTYNLDPEKTPFFQDVRTRQALLFALDRQAMVESIVFGLADVAHSVVPPISWAHNPDNKPQYDYNPATAKRLLDEAGWKDQDGDGVREAHGVEGVTDGTKFSIEVHTNAGNQEREQVMVAIQQYWAQVGVEVKTASVEWNALLAELMETHEYDVVVVGFTWDVDPDQKTMWHTESYGGGFNVNKYSNPDLDKILDDALATNDQETRKKLYFEMQSILAEEVPSPILYFRRGTECWNAQLHEYDVNDINKWYNAHQWRFER